MAEEAPKKSIWNSPVPYIVTGVVVVSAIIVAILIYNHTIETFSSQRYMGNRVEYLRNPRRFVNIRFEQQKS